MNKIRILLFTGFLLLSLVTQAEVYVDSLGKSRLAVSSQGRTSILGDSSQITEVSCGGPSTVPQPGFFFSTTESTITEYDTSFGVWHHCFLNSLTSSLSSKKLINWGLAGDIPTAADYDGNGITDYAVFRPSETKFYILYNSLSGPTGSSLITQFGLKGDTPFPIDIDNDGIDNISVFRKDSSTGELQFFYRDNLGETQKISFGLLTDIPIPGIKDTSQRNLIGVYRPLTGEWFIRSFTGSTSTFSFGLTGDVPLGLPYLQGLAYTPVVYRPREGNWYIKNGNDISRISFGVLGSKVLSDSNISSYSPKAYGDVDGDFLSDLSVVRNRSNNTAQVISYRFSKLGVPDSSFSTNIFNLVPQSSSTTSSTVDSFRGNGFLSLDFDGDKRTDFGSIRNDQGLIKWQLALSSNKNIKTLVEFQYGLVGDGIYPEDYDGDGSADLAVVRNTLSENGNTYKTWIVNPSSGISFSPYQWGFSSDKVFVGDVDGDRKTDSTVVRRTIDGLLWVTRLSSGDIITPFLFGSLSDKPHLMDLNGDGKVEPVVERESSSGQLNFYSSAISNTFTKSSVEWGVKGDIVLYGFDRGLRRGSIGVWRLINGQGFFFIRNTENTGDSTNIPFGVRGDMPILNGVLDLNSLGVTSQGQTGTSITASSLGNSQILNQNKRVNCNSYSDINLTNPDFLWKPNSDINSKLVILYNSKKANKNSKLYLVNQGLDQDTVLERLVYFGKDRLREVFRGTKQGSEYLSPLILVKEDTSSNITTSNSKVYSCIRIVNPGTILGR